MERTFEERLDTLREEAKAKGRVSGDGIHAAGSPMPSDLARAQITAAPGYAGLPIIKPPVWEWMIPLYFFIGGLAGMSGLMACAGLMKGPFSLVRVAMWAAGAGALISPLLLTWDLGRPLRFLHMLRVFKYQSPMSVGSWILSAFGACTLPGLALVEWQWQSSGGSSPDWALKLITWILVGGSGVTGIFLATYTGALIAVTAVPAWNVHRILLPFHFGMAGLGSAAALLELGGFRLPSLNFIGFFAASAETLVMLWLELRKHGAVDRALHKGRSGWTLRVGETLEGPLALILRGFGFVPPAAGAFLAGALVTRFGWLLAGNASACSPESVLASQRAHPGAVEEEHVHQIRSTRSGICS